MSSERHIALASRRPAGRSLEWMTTAGVVIVAIVAIWVTVASGPEICGLAFPGDGNCFASDRHRIGWIATSAVCAIVVVFTLLSLRGPSRRSHRRAWISSLALVAASTAIALFALT